jgi:hypothetical protein
MLYPRWLYCATCTSASDGNPGPVPCCRGLYAPSESRRRGPRGQRMTLGGDHDAPSSENLRERLRILVLRCSKFAHVNECRVFGIKDRKVEARVVVEILNFASQRLERPHGLTLDVVHGISIHALPRLIGADWCDDPRCARSSAYATSGAQANDSIRSRSKVRRGFRAAAIPPAPTTGCWH